MALLKNEIHSAQEFAYVLCTGEPLVLFKNTLTEQGDSWNYLFVDPVQVLQMYII